MAEETKTVTTMQHFDRRQIEIMRHTIAKDVPVAEFYFFLEVCKYRGLNPFNREIYAIMRDGRLTIQTGIDGLRKLADRSGKYQGQKGSFWCGSDGAWKDEWLSSDPPVAAKVGILRSDFAEPIWAIARYDAYVQRKKDGNPTDMWRRFHDVLLAKCFSEDTEVLTDQGFQRFSEVTGRVLQVTDAGLEPTEAKPFVQDYDGPMIVSNGDMLNFAVTPNHDMVTTLGKVEARALYATARTSGHTFWRIPLTVAGRTTEAEVDDATLRLLGYIAADGWHNGYRLFTVQVSRQYKREALATVSPVSTSVVHAKGTVATVETRTIRTNFDKMRFTFPVERVASFLDLEKRFHFEILLSLSQRQARILLDAWQQFDGYTNKQTGVRRIYTSRPDHVAVIEVLALLAGYAINKPRARSSDLSERVNYSITMSEPEPQPALLPIGNRPGLVIEQNQSGKVWCVTVPSGVIVVRRNGFAMVCGNCAEALAIRKAFPAECAGVYGEEEMMQADKMERELPQMTVEAEMPQNGSEMSNDDKAVPTQRGDGAHTPTSETVKTRFVAAYKISDAHADEKWTAFKTHVLGLPVADDGLSEMELTRLSGTIVVHEKSKAT